MRHAYLILAHNEFAVLERLLLALDDSRNDIFIHFDQKLSHVPAVHTKQAGLYIMDQRVDVRWGDVSVVEAEYALFEAANLHGPYAYYHLLSGVDLPLKSQDDIHDFFDSQQGKEFIGFNQEDNRVQMDRKVHRYHVFAKHFRYTGGLMAFLRRSIRYVLLQGQYVLGIRRHQRVQFKKGTQWVSVTDPFVKHCLAQKEKVLSMYAGTFCSDEIFLQTLCWHSSFRSQVFDLTDEGRGCMRAIGWENHVMKDWEESDFEELVASEALFARKFNSKELTLLDRIVQQIIPTS